MLSPVASGGAANSGETSRERAAFGSASDITTPARFLGSPCRTGNPRQPCINGVPVGTVSLRQCYGDGVYLRRLSGVGGVVFDGTGNGRAEREGGSRIPGWGRDPADRRGGLSGRKTGRRRGSGRAAALCL